MELWPQDSTKRSRPGQSGSAGLCRITFWNSRYAAGARLIAVPGWPLPTFWTASIASTRTVSTARSSISDQSSRVAWDEDVVTAYGSFLDQGLVPETHRPAGGPSHEARPPFPSLLPS